MESSFSFVIIVCILADSYGLPSIDWSKVRPNIIHVNADGPTPYINGTSSRVIGGHEVVPNSIPYMAAVRPDGVGFCGASLITPEWALTAAHCIDSASYTLVVLGAHRVLQNEPTQLVVPSRNIIIHPGWDINRLIHDIALVHLQEPVQESPLIHPIQIAPANSGSFTGSTGYLTGWGYTDDDNPVLSPTLQGVELRIISTEECRIYAGSWAHETNVCTHGFNGVHNVGGCFGDSGSPLVAEGLQVGIVSFGSGQCTSGSITSYARVSEYANWINQHIHPKHKWFNIVLTTEDGYSILNENAMVESNKAYSVFHCVAIIIKLEKQSSRLCAGSLITERYVLTAAHCLEGSQYAVLHLKTSKYDENPNFTLKSDTFKIHPDWQSNILLNDIALIEIPPHNFKINSIELSTKPRIKNKMGKLYGWERNTSDENAPPILKTHRVIVIQNNICAKLYGSLMRTTNVCTNASRFENGCHGFSGGPLLVDGTQIGIVSFGTTECHAGYPTVHTRVSKYKKWIQENSDISNSIN